MPRLWSWIGAFVTAAAAPASAQFFPSSDSRALVTRWTIEPAPPPQGIRELAAKELVVKQRLLPGGLIELGRNVTRAEAGADIVAGTQLIEVKGPAGAIFCEGELRLNGIGAGRQTCLVDSDGDARLDAAFRAASNTPALVMISDRMPKTTQPLAAPIPYQRIDPAKSRLGAFVAIERRNWFNIYGLEGFTILFGSADRQARITSPVQFKSSEMPKELNVLGARFTALAEKDGKMSIRVEEGMPAQDIGVTRTVSYR